MNLMDERVAICFTSENDNLKLNFYLPSTILITT